MARLFKATCPTCGDVRLTPDAITLHTDDTYRFSCTTCRTYVVRDANPQIKQLLARGGVTVKDVWRPSPRPDGRPFTLDDLLDWHLWLERWDGRPDAVGLAEAWASVRLFGGRS